MFPIHFTAAQRGRRYATGLLVNGLILVATSGCLSIGGKTTQVVSSPETDARVSSLELRVRTLEQAVGIRTDVPIVNSYEPKPGSLEAATAETIDSIDGSLRRKPLDLGGR